jgi:ribosomal protein L35
MSHKTGRKKQELRGCSYAKSADIKHLSKMLHRPLTPG